MFYPPSLYTYLYLYLYLSIYLPFKDSKDILVMLSDMDINAIAGTLKLYFRELPEPLLTDRLYPAFMEGIGTTSDPDHTNTIRMHLNSQL